MGDQTLTLRIHLIKLLDLYQTTSNKEDYSFEPVGSVDPTAPIVVEAVPNDDIVETKDENPSDTAILVGCGLLGWVVA